MAYRHVVEMASNESLRQRCQAAAAQQGEEQPDGWIANNMWHLAASPDWDDAWSYAKDVQTVNHNPDTGARDDVISDQMILSAVQARQAALAQP